MLLRIIIANLAEGFTRHLIPASSLSLYLCFSVSLLLVVCSPAMNVTSSGQTLFIRRVPKGYKYM